MKTTKHLSREGLKKPLISLLFACCAAFSFAQNIYKLDLNNFPARNDDKTISYDKKTGKVTIDKHGDVRTTTTLFYWLNNMDVSAYNIIRIKYEAPDGIGFSLHVAYPEGQDSYSWYETGIYCPSYLTEMVFPITAYPDQLERLLIASPWGANTCQFTIKEITFEKVDNPVYTNIHITNEPPVVDKATKTTIDAKADAWDFVPKLGVGYQYWAYGGEPTREYDFGFDFSITGYPKTRQKENLKDIKNKGFKTIRLLVNPAEQFMDDKYTLDPRFISEVKEFVDMAIEEDFYVILCGFFWAWEVTSPDSVNSLHPVRYESVIVNAKEQKRSEKVLKAFWSQIGTAFNNSYDEHLIFETMNEPGDDIHPQVEGHDGPIDLNCTVCKSDIKIGNGYNQLIVDTIRATGGNNANRFIMVAAFGNPWASYFKLPKDKAKNKLIPIAHIYPLGVENSINPLYSAGIKKVAITDIFEQIDKCFFKKHIPFYVSEVNAPRQVPILERINMMKDFMAEVTKPGRSCSVTLHFNPIPEEDDYWCYYNTHAGEWVDEEYLDTVLYAQQGKEYPLSDEFIKKNTVKVESLVGKELLAAPHQFEFWNDVNIGNLTRAVPSKYKLELVIEKTGPDPRLTVNYIDGERNWCYLIPEKKKVEGGTLEIYDNGKSNNIIPKAEKIVVGITEEYSPYIEYLGLHINGKDCLLKSVKVVE